MYKMLLILKYLRRKLAPMFAAVAVTLCTMMVIIVISVMGGFLDMLRGAARKLTGDVVVSSVTLSGMPHYEQIIESLEDLPQVESASPVIRTLGLLNLSGRSLGVVIEGIRPQEMAKIVSFSETLHWSTLDESGFASPEFLDSSLALKPPDDWQFDSEGKKLPPEKGLSGIVIGIEVNPYHRRNDEGQYDALNRLVGAQVTLTAVPLSEQGMLGAYEPTYRKFLVVNEFKSGLYEVDANVVFVPFKDLQQMLEMQSKQVWMEFDEQTGEPIGEPTLQPARTTKIVVAGAASYSDREVQEAVEKVVRRFFNHYPRMLPPVVETWEQVHGTLLRAVANEKGLVTFLFVIISVVAIVMVATTFYMIVLEKTRDIGVLRALGASRWGIANIFLGYGLSIGILGAFAGLGLATAIVTHLNEIQYLLDLWFGWRMWDPQTYFFDRIPGRIDLKEASLIVLGAIFSSVVGALIPALLAARLNPVEALRYE